MRRFSCDLSFQPASMQHRPFLPIDCDETDRNKADVNEKKSPRNAASKSSFWRFFKETRTRILLLYALSLLLLSAAAVPIFRYFLFASVNSRVQESLKAERAAFQSTYADWESAPNQSDEDLKAFIDEFLRNTRPEDDNSQIVLIEDELYRSNPNFLLESIRPGSNLFDRWQRITEPVINEEPATDSKTGSVIYAATPVELDGVQKGVFVVAHVTAGEREEALTGVYLFARTMLVVVLMSLLLSWIFAGRLMAPIASLSRTARSISESDLDQRIPPPAGHDDLSELTHTFNAMMDRLQSSFNSQRDFIDDAGHELRTPITIIRGHLELMDDDPQERAETMELVMDELDRMGRLVNDMILLAKSERPNFLQLETISVRSLAEDLFAKAATLADRQWLLAGEAAGTVMCDRQKLTGAILNLLRNAAQHTQASDTIELGYQFTQCRFSPEKSPQRCVQLWVRDSGAGISPEEQQRIFARFARGRQLRRSDGSGLGLAIAKAVAEAHGGRITIESQQGRGATFCLSIPTLRPS